MAIVINMPRLSDTMEEGVVAKWLINIGDVVNECEKFAEESPYPDPKQMYDMVYEQEDYPFIS